MIPGPAMCSHAAAALLSTTGCPPISPPSKLPHGPRALRMDTPSPSHLANNKSIGWRWIAGGRQRDKLQDSWKSQAG